MYAIRSYYETGILDERMGAVVDDVDRDRRRDAVRTLEVGRQRHAARDRDDQGRFMGPQLQVRGLRDDRIADIGLGDIGDSIGRSAADGRDTGLATSYNFV